VSMEVAIAMAEGAILMSRADISISVTGIAGPGGGSKAKPVGTVFIGCSKKGQNAVYEKFLFNGDRNMVRLQAAESAINAALKMLKIRDK